MLLEAFHVWKAETSGATGYPLWLTRSADPNLQWDVIEVEDMADRALEEWDESNAGKRRRKGVSRVAVPRATDESLLSGGVARMHHYETMQLQAEVEAAAVRPDEEDEDLDIDRFRPPQGYDASQYG